VATRPPSAPWVNPPLRSLRWVESMLTGLAKEGFSDEQVLFTYRTFNGFLLGYLRSWILSKAISSLSANDR
jgi:hypothetical protein